MWIPVKELVEDWNVYPKGVLHIGAHIAEESAEYTENYWSPVVWIEGQPSLIEQLEKSLPRENNRVINAVVWSENDIPLKLHIASNTQSTSLLEFESHKESHPDIKFVENLEVLTKRVDSIFNESDIPDFVNIDIQGAELQALIGFGDLINCINYIYVEVNKRHVYTNCALVGEIDQHLAMRGFERVATRWYKMEGWGDALYIRAGLKMRQSIAQLLRSRCRTFAYYLKMAPSVTKSIIIRGFYFNSRS